MSLQQMMAMFSQGAGGGGLPPPSAVLAVPLVSFKAGRLTCVGPSSGGAYQITADKKRGTLALVRSTTQHPEGEGVISLQWTERNGKDVKQNLLLFGDAIFRKVDTRRPNDRVYVLQYNMSDRRFFFW